MNDNQRDCEHVWVYFPPGRYRCANCSYVWYGLQPPNAAEQEAAKYPRSLRDEFAMAALPVLAPEVRAGSTPKDLAIWAYEVADAMIEVRKQ